MRLRRFEMALTLLLLASHVGLAATMRSNWDAPGISRSSRQLLQDGVECDADDACQSGSCLAHCCQQTVENCAVCSSGNGSCVVEDWSNTLLSVGSLCNDSFPAIATIEGCTAAAQDLQDHGVINTNISTFSPCDTTGSGGINGSFFCFDRAFDVRDVAGLPHGCYYKESNRIEFRLWFNPWGDRSIIDASRVAICGSFSASPTISPTTSPSVSPTSAMPTFHPSRSPTSAPTSNSPSQVPSTSPTTSPTTQPTHAPSTRSPTASPTFSFAPTESPIQSLSPSSMPTLSLTRSPSKVPTLFPTMVPSHIQTGGDVPPPNTPESSSDNESFPVALVAGIVGACVFFFLVMVLVAVLVKFREKKRDLESSSTIDKLNIVGRFPPSSSELDFGLSNAKKAKWQSQFGDEPDSSLGNVSAQTTSTMGSVDSAIFSESSHDKNNEQPGSDVNSKEGFDYRKSTGSIDSTLKSSDSVLPVSRARQNAVNIPSDTSLTTISSNNNDKKVYETLGGVVVDSQGNPLYSDALPIGLQNEKMDRWKIGHDYSDNIPSPRQWQIGHDYSTRSSVESTSQLPEYVPLSNNRSSSPGLYSLPPTSSTQVKPTTMAAVASESMSNVVDGIPVEEAVGKTDSAKSGEYGFDTIARDNSAAPRYAEARTATNTAEPTQANMAHNYDTFRSIQHNPSEDASVTGSSSGSNAGYATIPDVLAAATKKKNKELKKSMAPSESDINVDKSGYAVPMLLSSHALYGVPQDGSSTTSGSSKNGLRAPLYTEIEGETLRHQNLAEHGDPNRHPSVHLYAKIRPEIVYGVSSKSTSSKPASEYAVAHESVNDSRLSRGSIVYNAAPSVMKSAKESVYATPPGTINPKQPIVATEPEGYAMVSKKKSTVAVADSFAIVAKEKNNDSAGPSPSPPTMVTNPDYGVLPYTAVNPAIRDSVISRSETIVDGTLINMSPNSEYGEVVFPADA